MLLLRVQFVYTSSAVPEETVRSAKESPQLVRVTIESIAVRRAVAPLFRPSGTSHVLSELAITPLDAGANSADPAPEKVVPEMLWPDDWNSILEVMSESTTPEPDLSSVDVKAVAAAICWGGGGGGTAR